MELARLSASDAPACEELALDRGWEVGEARWRLLLEAGPGWGVFVPGVGLAGTSFLFDYGGVALVAMVLVRTALARRGIARRLVGKALEAAPAATYLYATEAGRPLYEQLGFVAVEDLAKYSGRPGALRPPQAAELRPLADDELPAAARLDESCFGAPRDRVLGLLAKESVRRLGAWRDGALVGYGLATRVGGHVLVGPVAAREEAVGVQLVAALAEGQPAPVRIDAPAGHLRLRGWAEEAGLSVDPAVPLMTLGGRALPGRREGLIAVASRGLG